MPVSQSLKTHSAKLCAAALLSMSGCASRVILVPDGEPLLLAEPIKARVLVMSPEGKLIRSQNRVTIPAGWYALPKE